MNNEPVAWIEPDVIPLTHIIKAVVRREQDEQYSIPLYTHPVKELTDEEIISTMVQFDVYSSDDHCLIEAGRAILRKASEK
jgi:hypothetical protein